MSAIDKNTLNDDPYRISLWARINNNRDILGFIFMVPTGVMLLVFLAYPLVLGIWLGFTDAKLVGEINFIGFDNYVSLMQDEVFLTSIFNTTLYTVVASVVKFALGLWLAMILNNHIPFKAFLRAIILLPFIVPTVLSAMAFWWIYDAQDSIISWVLIQFGILDRPLDFLGQPNLARGSVIAANVWRGIPFIAITLLAGLQSISPSLYEAAAMDGATRWQMFRRITYPLLTPIIAVVMTFSVLFTFTDFQLIWVMTRGGPFNATHLMATLSFQRAIEGGAMGEGSAIATAMIPFLLSAILFSYFGLQRRKWQQGSADD